MDELPYFGAERTSKHFPPVRRSDFGQRSEYRISRRFGQYLPYKRSISRPRSKVPLASFCFLSYFVLYWDDLVLSRNSCCRSIFPFPVLGRVSRNSTCSGTM